MQTIKLSVLIPGMSLDLSFFLDDNFILLAPEMPITEDFIDLLKELEIKNLKYRGAVNSEEKKQQNNLKGGAALNDDDGASAKNETLKFYQKWVQELKAVFGFFSANDKIRTQPVEKLASEIIVKLKDNDQKAFFPTFNEEGLMGHIQHSVKTAALAAIIGKRFKFSATQMADLVCAALIHRLGMLRLPQKYYLAESRLSPEELKVLRTYPLLGYKIAKDCQFLRSVCLGVLHHQERLNGSGYPQGLSEKLISHNGAILAVCNSYVAAVSRRSFKNSLNPHQGVLDMLKGAGTEYDLEVIKTLISFLSLYPINTCVELNSGARGIVVDTDSFDPKAVTVKIVLNEEGESVKTNLLIKIGSTSGLSVTRVLTGEAKKKLLGHLNN